MNVILELGLFFFLLLPAVAFLIWIGEHEQQEKDRYREKMRALGIERIGDTTYYHGRPIGGMWSISHALQVQEEKTAKLESKPAVH